MDWCFDDPTLDALLPERSVRRFRAAPGSFLRHQLQRRQKHQFVCSTTVLDVNLVRELHHIGLPGDHQDRVQRVGNLLELLLPVHGGAEWQHRVVHGVVHDDGVYRLLGLLH